MPKHKGYSAIRIVDSLNKENHRGKGDGTTEGGASYAKSSVEAIPKRQIKGDHYKVLRRKY